MTEANGSTPKHCAGVRRDGAPCLVTMLADGSHCFAHAPGRADERAAARRRGGEGKSTIRRAARVMPQHLRPVFEKLSTALDDVLTGNLDPKQASAAAALGRALVAVMMAGETEDRLRDVEALVHAERRNGTTR